jgi:hypothetical protein
MSAIGIRCRIELVALVVLLSVAGLPAAPAGATPLPPGGIVPPSAVATFPLPNTTLLASATASVSQTLGNGDELRFVFFNAVYRDNIGGTLDFILGVLNTSPETGGASIGGVELEHLAGFSTDVEYYFPCGGNQVICVPAQEPPDLAARSPGAGDIAAFLFITSQIDPGEASATLIIRTNATAFDANGLALILPGSGVCIDPCPPPVTVSAFEPAGAVPAPGTLWLVGAAVPGLAIRSLYPSRRRRA